MWLYSACDIKTRSPPSSKGTTLATGDSSAIRDAKDPAIGLQHRLPPHRKPHLHVGAKRAIPAANAALIVANVLIFWLGWSGPWTVGPGSGVLSIVTHAFSHFSIWHLVGNMWVLLVFGNPVNRRVGNTYYLLGYLGTVVALGLFAKLFLSSQLAGASGAIFAVIAMALLLMPAAILEVGYLAVFPITLLVGLVRRPKHWLYWFIRWGKFSFRVVSSIPIYV